MSVGVNDCYDLSIKAKLDGRSTPRRHRLRARRKPVPLGDGISGNVFSVKKYFGKELAMKVQPLEKEGVRGEYVFAQVLDKAQTDGVLPKDIHFARAQGEDVGQEYYQYYPDGKISAEGGRQAEKAIFSLWIKCLEKLKI